MRPLRHAPLGRCLYCLATGVPLTEEHLIPRALGGRATLRDAVCEPCRRYTGRFEQVTLDREFAVPKTLLALKRRRARGKGPERMPSVVLEAGAVATSTLTPDTFPRGFSLPMFESAGLLSSVDRASTLPCIEFSSCHLRLGTPRVHHVAAPPALPEPHAYAYAIAKWAYGMAVAKEGFDACDMHAIRDLLAGRRGDVFNFVGSARPGGAAGSAGLHSATIQTHGAWRTVVLHLLSSAGLSPYEIVIGASGRCP
jgi:hypothetical protein